MDVKLPVQIYLITLIPYKRGDATKQKTLKLVIAISICACPAYNKCTLTA
jgi:hypothetical protein